MNKELIARIDELKQFNVPTNGCVYRVLEDCKAEIERLEAENHNMDVHVRKVQADRDRMLLANETLTGLCEDYQAQIKELESELAKAKEYVPMTNSEWDTLDLEKNNDELHAFEWEKIVESEVIKRANLVVKENRNDHTSND